MHNKLYIHVKYTYYFHIINIGHLSCAYSTGSIRNYFSLHIFLNILTDFGQPIAGSKLSKNEEKN